MVAALPAPEMTVNIAMQTVAVIACLLMLCIR
jgi:hypothetical protein